MRNTLTRVVLPILAFLLLAGVFLLGFELGRKVELEKTLKLLEQKSHHLIQPAPEKERGMWI